MGLHDDAAYLALRTHDARFDGRLFVGVTSTGIYCRPTCRVRTPLRRNCRFFANAAGAERAGFRPCLRCRPELAPGLSFADSSQVLAQHAARRIEQAARSGTALRLSELAARLGVTDRHLRRIFQQAHGVSPMDYLSTQRLLLAKQLLTDTALPVTQVALASGHTSLRRFNAAFAQRYRMSPSALRQQAAPARAREAALPLRLAYRPPYDIDGVLRFLKQRALPGVESVDALELRRTLRWAHQGQELHGWLQCRFEPQRHELHLAVAPVLLPAVGAILQRLRHALDLDADPALIAPGLASLPRPARDGVRVPGAFDSFETAARIVLGQQVSVAAARTLAGRLVAEFGLPVTTPFAELGRLFPSAADIAAAEPQRIGALGIVRQRVAALQALAREVAASRIELHPGAPLEPTLQALHALPGIGEWTVQLIAMRTLAWPDAFAATDIGVCKALGTRDAAAVLARAEAWRPWRAYALMSLWQTLEQAT
ncbi:MAG TPA: AlkA N-terminal domain-containing protein [Rubrivivax sp.]|nr:AlkA N-terminal domain-containing protein [Rubrivivax sp.]HPO19453.1 AlkA N-terminal domain-containing protein [Rubrivivax sp.]